MKIAIVANPCSGGNKTRKLLPKAEKKLYDLGIEADIFLSRHPAHIRELAMDLDIHKYQGVVAMGGDGTNFHLINGLALKHNLIDLPPLGIIPAGSGNSFVKDLGITSLDQAVQVIARNQPIPVDLLSYTGSPFSFYFINLMGLGFVTDVAVTAERFKMFHDLSYLVGVIHRTAFLDCMEMSVVVDNQTYDGPFCFVEFCNSRFTGGSMLMAPDAKIDDGLMDIVMVRRLTRTQLLSALPRIFTGSHVDMDQVICARGKKVGIITQKNTPLLPDGEVLGSTPGKVEIIPNALRYFT